MKNEIIGKILAVINTLNLVSVSGKENLGNLVGSINVLEDVVKSINRAEVIVNVADLSDTAEKGGGGGAAGM